MWPFKSVKTLRKSGIFEGFTDWHSHILPGVDDGINSMEDSISLLKLYEELGIKKIWLTPHVMEDYPNTTDELRQRFSELSKEWTGGIELCLASENMLDNLFEERLAARDLLPIGDEGNHLLVETSYYTPPMGMDELLERVKSSGYFPILAHPERYRYMEERDYKKYKDMGILFQMNIISLVGGYGETARKKAEWLLSKDMVDVIGSDVHRLDSIQKGIDSAPHSNSILTNLCKVNNEI